METKSLLSSLPLTSSIYLTERLKVFEKLKLKDQERILKISKIPIKCSLASGETFDGISFETTPKDFFPNIKLDKKVIAARVNGELWDLGRPLETDSVLEYVGFDEPDGKHIFWHSSAHVLGEALEKLFKAKLCSGPPTEAGFFYDVFMDNRVVFQKDLEEIRNRCLQIIKEKQKFERITVKKADLLELFQHNEFKIRIIGDKVEDFTTVYKCGTLVDLCRGPHLDHTGVISAFAITKNSSSYWRGQSINEQLQRIYGISFPTNDELKQWQKMQEEAEKRDHRKLGRENELFFFHELSPGSCFFLPKGAHIYNKLCDFMRKEYNKRGFTEVISPNIYNIKLWKTSGHYENYAENMFAINVENEEFAMKPMNCPGHCLMFSLRPRSWKELPLRLADFGVLHRNEFSGALSGLTRVRRFCQDDAHIFCTLAQVGDEIQSCLNFLFYVHEVFGFATSIKLSTKPEKFIGDSETWEKAEIELKKALNNSGKEWDLNPGDGAFYGPKIDIQVKDALGRQHQISTIQLDFNLPKRFQLKYIDDEDKIQEPVMIHRAILGSLERVIGILTETYAGKWPFWLNPTQFVIISMTKETNSYVSSIQDTLRSEGFTTEVSNDPTISLNKKIRNAFLMNVNFVILIGKKEKEQKTVSLRTRKGNQINDLKLEELIPKFHSLDKNYRHGDDIDS